MSRLVFACALIALLFATLSAARLLHPLPALAASGVLTTAGKLLFGGDPSGNLVAFDPANGALLWHSAIGQVTNAPQTYMVDGRQFVLAAAGDMLYAFALYQ